jgi:hypothetical protein
MELEQGSVIERELREVAILDSPLQRKNVTREVRR